MAQITTGVRRILSHPMAYQFTQNCLGANKLRKTFVREYIKPNGTDTILDIGCGTADILHFLPPSVNYVGFDLNPYYIHHAKKQFGSRATFFCEDVNNAIHNLPKSNIVLATGLLHHLDDDEVEKLFNLTALNLSENGRLFTFDGCYVDTQSKFAKFMISKDRGQNIRSPKAYQSLALQTFANVKLEVRHDLLWIPYTHAVMECSKVKG